MKRRNFIKHSSPTGMFAITTVKLTGTTVTANIKDTNTFSINDDFELNEITIDDLQQKMKTGVYTSRSITLMYLERINKIDKAGPAINSIIELNPDAISIADEMDKERKSGKVRGLLHGIPVSIKYTINSRDK